MKESLLSHFNDKNFRHISTRQNQKRDRRLLIGMRIEKSTRRIGLTTIKMRKTSSQFEDYQSQFFG